ncbi:hypothetical protein [Dyella flagellata]|uniref:Uncharacterized protein n=1 Tax=Dyella flagellata TaxID=1867833 RepID=A0ABQ5XJW2_9GAMM|nr:hypothetical protein [Dyella flagellata]GLQ90906.1 hypothetical protein GCM10007898_44820 [Dyella flagellata]
MHLELPKAPLESLKDFLKHYLMIVLSILTALGLEAWIEHVHHRHAAEAASEQIEAEIRINLADVNQALAADTHQVEVLTHLRDSLEQDLKANVSNKEMQQHILSQIDSFTLNLRWPALRHEAWDVSVANQSASWIDSKRMYRYSAVYATQREADNKLTANLQLTINGPRMIDNMTDLRSGSVEPREFLHVVAQMEVIQQQAKSSLGQLQQRMQNALNDSTR